MTRRFALRVVLLFGAATGCETGASSGFPLLATDAGPAGAGTEGGALVAEAGPPSPANIGAACVRNDECDSRLCLVGRCTTPCSGAVDCPPSPEWTCALSPGSGSVCACSATGSELCDGRDNDCNGGVDDGAPCPGSSTCEGGGCVCPTENQCGTACVDKQTDVGHCGACTVACPVGALCLAGACSCPIGTSLCNDGCVDLSTDAAHCGSCADACGPLENCVTGVCVCAHALCDGRCASLDDDALHCGRCGHDCGGGACVNGQCQPVELLHRARAQQLATDGKSLYWTTLATSFDDAGDVMKAGLDGGGQETIAADLFQSGSGAAALAVNASGVYWSDYARIGRVAFGSSTPSTIVEGFDGGTIYSLAVDAAHVYWTTQDADAFGRVNRADLDGSNATTLVVSSSTATAARGLVVTDTNLYWLQWGDTGESSVQVSKLDGSDVSTVRNQFTESMVADATSVYLSMSGSISRITWDGQERILTNGSATRLVVDPTALYWSGYGPGNLGGIFCTLLPDGETRRVLASELPLDLVSSGAHLYYINRPWGDVMRLAK